MTVLEDRTVPAVFINELNYLSAAAPPTPGPGGTVNASTDDGTDASSTATAPPVGPFVEVAGATGTALTGWSVALYDGPGSPGAGTSYYTLSLSGTLANQQNGFGTLAFTFPAGTVHADADAGLALVNASGQVVQFLSYGGAFAASSGPAAGQTSLNIGVQQQATDPAGDSLQLTGTGSAYANFTWTGPAAASPGAVNAGQTFVPDISVTNVNDAVEDGTNGVFQFTRTGDPSTPLTVAYTVGGSASAGTDYTPLPGTVTFGASAATATATVVALPGSVDGSDVTVTIAAGAGYSVGSAANAALSIIDNYIPPTAFDGQITTSVNEAASISVLDLSSDLNGDSLTVVGVTQGTDGSVVLNPDGTVTYTPNAGYSGDDTFTYTVEDPSGAESTGAVSVTVTAPQAAPTSVWTAASTPIVIAVLNLAFDPDGEALTVAGVTQGDNGTAVLNSDGTVTYTPNTAFAGNDSFTYTVTDPRGNEVTETVAVTVGTTAPIAVGDQEATSVNTALNVALPNLAYQPAGGALTVTAVTQGANGSVVLNTDGTATYTPNAGFEGTDTFTYTVTDANAGTATGTVTVTTGPPPATPASEIEADLSTAQGDLNNFNSGTPAALAAMLPAITASVNTYLSDVSSFTSANSIDMIGTNKSVKDFVEAMGPAYKGLYNDYINLLAIR